MPDETVRRSYRTDTRQGVRLKNARGGVEAVWLMDLSPTGCKVLLRYGRPRVGDSVALLAAGLERIAGVVRWTKADRAGIEFSRPLHPAVADHLAKASFADDDTQRRSTFGSADSLGRRLLPRPGNGAARSVA
ncbi:MAG TPA: PilZ domain-containing protein [Novosphingobium sp.]|nr:PilZ domain-containing protein [Novosphingobium sp.]